MSEKSSIDIFVTWAKNRLDDMSVHAKILEKRLDGLSDDIREQTEDTIDTVKIWMKAGEDKIKEAQEQGEVAITETHEWFEELWKNFNKMAEDSEKKTKKE